jgi:hypothetical protein
LIDGDAQRGTLFAPMHSVTRLGRVIQQLRSFTELHADELEGMAVELEAIGAADVAGRLRLYRDMQRDEAQLVLDEIVDIQSDMAAAAQPETLADARVSDPAVDSPKRARWLAEQAAETERRKQPFSRRDFFGGAAQKTE